MQIAIRKETEICEYCLSILLLNGECPYCGRQYEYDEEEEDECLWMSKSQKIRTLPKTQ